MLKNLSSSGSVRCIYLNSCTPLFPFYFNHVKTKHINKPLCYESFKFVRPTRFSHISCSARRRARYDDEEEEDEVEDEKYEFNEEITKLEAYTQSAKNEALLVKAIVDEEEVEILIFKGFSSSLSYRTSADPSTSILPKRAVIQRIDIVKGPFNPSNIEYIDKNLSLENFKSRI